MATKTRKPNTKLETVVLPDLFDHPGSTVKQISERTGVNVQPTYLFNGLEQGLVARVGREKHTNAEGVAQRGRPQNTYKLTDKARKRVKAARKAAEKAANAEPVTA